MNDEQIERWCPQCREVVRQLETPLLAPIAQSDDCYSLATDPVGHQRKFHCDRCQYHWKSVELPASFVDELRASRKSAVDAQRRIAMLRLLVASERRRHEQNSGASAETPNTRAA